MKKLIALILLTPSLYAEDLELICEGTVTEKKVEQVSSRTTGSGANSSQRTRINIPTESTSFAAVFLTLNMEDETGVIEVPAKFRRKGAKLTKNDLEVLDISEKFIKGKVKWNVMANASFTVDRRSGVMEYISSGNITFNGMCEKYEKSANKF